MRNFENVFTVAMVYSSFQASKHTLYHCNVLKRAVDQQLIIPSQ
jgi:hypothetical protein